MQPRVVVTWLAGILYILFAIGHIQRPFIPGHSCWSGQKVLRAFYVKNFQEWKPFAWQSIKGNSGETHEDTASRMAAVHTADEPHRSDRQCAPKPRIDFSEYARQQGTRWQQSLDMSWSKDCHDVEREADYVKVELGVIGKQPSAIPGIRDWQRRMELVDRFLAIQVKAANVRQECQNRNMWHENDNTSVASFADGRSSVSKASSTFSQKEKLKAALLARKKLELAQARAVEEAEGLRRSAEEETRKRLRDLEEATGLTEPRRADRGHEA